MPLIQLLILAIWLGLPLVAIRQILSARRRIIERTCPECDYDMTGTTVGGPCPECGIIPAISRSRSTDPERVLCRNCGHDLEGLPWDADCPECGLRSAALPRFTPARPRYRLRAVLGGVLLAIWVGLTAIVVIDWYDSYRYDRMRGAALRARQTPVPHTTTVPEGDRD